MQWMYFFALLFCRKFHQNNKNNSSKLAMHVLFMMIKNEERWNRSLCNGLVCEKKYSSQQLKNYYCIFNNFVFIILPNSQLATRQFLLLWFPFFYFFFIHGWLCPIYDSYQLSHIKFIFHMSSFCCTSTLYPLELLDVSFKHTKTQQSDRNRNMKRKIKRTKS